MHHSSGEADTAAAAALDSCGVVIVATDRDGRVRAWNQAATDLFGWEAAEVRGELCPLSPIREDGSLEAATETALDGTPVRDIPVTVTAKDGTDHSLDLTLTPLETDGDGPDGLVAMFTETARKRIAHLEERITRLEEFASSVAHDLRGPLNAATASVQLAQDGDDAEEHLARAGRCLDRIETIIEDLLSLNCDAGDGPTLTDVWLSEVVEEAWATIDAPTAHLLDDEDVSLTADRGQLRRLVANLLRNAVEHGAAETEDVTVRVGALDDGTGFYVADDGPGIPEDRRDDVFDFGYTTDVEGTGYGLTIVQRIADVHGWSVTVTDSQYGGARFEVYENFPNSDS